MVWTPAIGKIQKAIEDKGYFECPYSFQKFSKEHGVDGTGKTVQKVSINFWSDQDPVLTNRG